MNCYRCTTPIPENSRFCLACGADVSDPASPQATLRTAAGVAEMVRILRQETAGEYEIEKELGKGGMAAVYLATELQLRRKVAIKVLPPELTYGDGAIERFRREARTAASLDHPNIIPIYRIAPTGTLFWYAMKFIDGQSLQQLLDVRKRFPLAETLGFLRPIGDALDYAHAHGIVHRDIKPSNIMLDNRGWLTIADFGIAKELAAGSLTTSGAWLGSPSHMSPEQCAGTPITGATDQYAVGVIAYQLLSGVLPFQADSLLALLQMHRYEHPKPLEDLCPGLPSHVYDAVGRALSKDPAARFDSVRSFVAALENAHLGASNRGPTLPIDSDTRSDMHRPEGLARETPPPARRKPATRRTMAGVTALLLMAAGYLAWNRSGARPATAGAAAPPAATTGGTPDSGIVAHGAIPAPATSRTEQTSPGAARTTQPRAGFDSATRASDARAKRELGERSGMGSGGAGTISVADSGRSRTRLAEGPTVADRPTGAQPNGALPTSPQIAPTFDALVKGEISRIEEWIRTGNKNAVRRVLGAEQTDKIWTAMEGHTRVVASARVSKASVVDSTAAFSLAIADQGSRVVVFSSAFRATFLPVPGGVKLYTASLDKP